MSEASGVAAYGFDSRATEVHHRWRICLDAAAGLHSVRCPPRALPLVVIAVVLVGIGWSARGHR